MPTERNKDRVYRALELFNRGALEAYLEIYAEDAVAHGLGLEPGLESIRQFYRGILAGCPDAHVDTEDLLAEGDKVVCRFTFTGTHQGLLMGIPPTGKAVSMGGLSILRFAGGKCVERWTQADFLGLMQQLGAVPAPEHA